jgi:hypothetical protein
LVHNNLTRHALGVCRTRKKKVKAPQLEKQQNFGFFFNCVSSVFLMHTSLSSPFCVGSNSSCTPNLHLFQLKKQWNGCVMAVHVDSTILSFAAVSLTVGPFLWWQKHPQHLLCCPQCICPH